MLVAFARNQTMVVKKLAGQSILYTDPHPVGDANYCEATLLAPVLFTQNPGTVTLTVQAWGSNDGANWFQISGIEFTITAASTTPNEDADYVTCAFIRFKLLLETTAANNDDLAAATFDLHANLTRK